jgi:hypothetical protein
MSDLRENAIEWYTGQRTITVTISQEKYRNKIKTLAKTHSEVKIICTNPDGTILAKLPLKYLKISPPRHVSEEQREQMRERFLARQNKEG